MKKLLLSLLMMFGITMITMAQTQDVVYLNNGGIIKGSILEKAQTGTLKIQTKDGSVFVLNEQEIKSISEEKMTHINNKKVLNLPKHSFGIRAGALLSKDMFLNYDWLFDYQDALIFCPGAHIGGVYEISLNKTNRWFFQTGLDIQYRRGKYSEIIASDNPQIITDSRSTERTTNSLYLEIPAMFSCKFIIGNNTVLYPSFGLASSIGVWGHIKQENRKNGQWITAEGNPFVFNESVHEDEINVHGRSSLDFKASLNLTIKDVYIGGGFFAPIYNFSRFEAFSGQWGFNLSVGYNF